MLKVKRALISVSDKTGLIEFARGLQALGVEIISTGGTAKILRQAGISAQDISDYTGFPEMLDGRVKTLHPVVHGGLLAIRDNPEHMKQALSQGIGLIDMVVVNLYPFAKVIQKPRVRLDEAIENIDIGGPAMLRSAAKNFEHVAVICNPEKYNMVLQDMQANSGILPDRLLFALAVEAFAHTAEYDRLIHYFLNGKLQGATLSGLPRNLSLDFIKIQDLRYGENPHQAAACYREANAVTGLATMKQRHGKELSFNNILDLNSAVNAIKDFADAAAVIIKHNNPCGLAEDKVLSRAYQAALACDPLSSFGGIIGLNRRVDSKTAACIARSGFMECVIAPGYDPGALKILQEKKNFRILELDFQSLRQPAFDFKKIAGGLLYQQEDTRLLAPSDLKIVSKIKPTKSQMTSLLFAWKVVKIVKSNAIVVVKGRRVVGIGAGQTSRVGSVAIALKKAGKTARGAVLASDAFFPKTDNIRLAAKAGIKAVIHSGGSIADDDVIREANRCKLALIATGVRHFKH